MSMIRTYSELKRIRSYEGRYDYLRLGGAVGRATLGFERYLSQTLYKSKRWREARDRVIVRDNGCDLGIENHEIYDRIVIHHMNPITIKDIEENRDELYDPEYLISTAERTHTAIHYSDESLLPKAPIARRRNDTCPWK